MTDGDDPHRAGTSFARWSAVKSVRLPHWWSRWRYRVGRRHARRAQTFFQNQRIGAGVRSAQSAYEIWRSNRYEQDALMLLVASSQILVGAHRPGDALWFADEAMRYAHWVSDPMALARALDARASVAYEAQDYPSALTYWTRMLAEAELGDDESWRLEAHEGIGLAQQKLGEFDAAEASFVKAKALADAANDRERVADQIANLGWLADARGTPSRELFTQALHVYREVNDERGIRFMEDELADLEAPTPPVG